MAIRRMRSANGDEMISGGEMLKTNEPMHCVSYKVAHAPSDDSDQPVHSYSLIRVLTGLSVGTQGSNRR